MKRLVVLLFVMGLAACGEKDAAEAFGKSIDSWSATLKLVAEARLAKEVGSGFATKTAEAAIEDLAKQVGDPSLPRDQITRAERVIGAASELRLAVASNDAAGLARAREVLAATPEKSK